MAIRTLLIISALVVFPSLEGQMIRVISSSDRSPIAHVAVYNSTKDRAAITDTVGLIDLSIFPNSDTIIFQHPSYIPVHYTRAELAEINQIMLDRKKILIDEYVISATKSRENKLSIPNRVDVLEKSMLLESTGLTGAEILEGTGNILVQRSQGGGGSPILRGFEANKILLVVDGVRMNNAIYRSGHLQNSITIDPGILDRTEVIFGPTSIIYGSDALGGVIHYYTKDPQLSEDQRVKFSAGAYTRYSSASNSKTGHLDFSLGGKYLAMLTSISYKNLGDLRMGARRNPTLGDWGKQMHHVVSFNGTDSTVLNEDPLVQKNTGYSQVDILQKFRYTPSRYVDWILNFQYSTSSDIDRFDKLNDYSGINLKYAEYYYGPQNRLLVSLKNILKKDNALFTNMTTILAFQDIDEDRYSRKFRSDQLLIQEEDVRVYSLNADFLKIWGSRHKLNYGLEVQMNTVGSSAWYEDRISGVRQAAQSRYPEGGSLTWSASGYASYKWFMGEKMVLNVGSRYNYAGLSSDFENSFVPIDRIDIKNGALTGSIGLVYTPAEKWQIRTIFSSGFRNPNVDDYGKVRAKDGWVSVPNEELSPEYSYNAELGVSRVVEGFMKIELVGYYTYLVDAIVRTPYQLQGEDSLLYDGDMYRISTNYNAGRSYIYGTSLGFTSNLNRSITLKGTMNYTVGHNLTDDVPLGHIPPIFGRTTLTYRKSRFYLDTYVIYQGWKHTEDFSPYGEDNDGEAMEYGFPSWWTANMKAGIKTGKYLDFMIAVENIFDQFYKPYASGISGPGRNFILTARFTL